MAVNGLGTIKSIAKPILDASARERSGRIYSNDFYEVEQWNIRLETFIIALFQ